MSISFSLSHSRIHRPGFRHFVWLGLVTLTFSGILSPFAQAQNWHNYSAKGSLFDVRILDNVEETALNFRINSKTVAQSGQAVAVSDQRPYKDSVTHYIVRFDQSLGVPVHDKDIRRFIIEDLDVFANYYSNMNGKIHSRENFLYQYGVPGGEIKISYDDPNMGRQHIRMRTFFSGVSKIQQILMGNEDKMNSFVARKFFDSLYAKDGYKVNDGNVQKEWPAHTSPSGMFTAFLPDKVSPYVPANVDITQTDKFERMSFRFYDPIWREMIFYNVYGHKLPKEKLNFLDVETFLEKEYVSRHLSEYAANLRIDRFMNNNLPIIETSYPIESPKNYPYVDRVRLRAQFLGDSVVVHEIIAANYFVTSKFMDYVMQSVVFHPGQQLQEYLDQNESVLQEGDQPVPE
ncbi:MAG: hypothetical protein KDI11_05730 [Alphaproteobacteria bacterium]|nr:hypothetical protein [Alphaproteobacteria bacterium]